MTASSGCLANYSITHLCQDPCDAPRALSRGKETTNRRGARAKAATCQCTGCGCKPGRQLLWVQRKRWGQPGPLMCRRRWSRSRASPAGRLCLWGLSDWPLSIWIGKSCLFLNSKLWVYSHYSVQYRCWNLRTIKGLWTKMWSNVNWNQRYMWGSDSNKISWVNSGDV